MRLEVWSDVVCPYCFIGRRHLALALEQLPWAHELEITWRSFQLAPDRVPKPGSSVNDYLAEKYGMTVEQAQASHDRMAQMAAEVGAEMNFDRAVPANTFDAHRAIHLAREHGAEQAIVDALFKAYFTDGRDINDRSELAKIVAEAGVPHDAAIDTLASGRFGDAVRAEIEDGLRLGLRGVPFFVVDRKLAVAGAQPPDTLVAVLEKGRQYSRMSADEWADFEPETAGR